MKRLWILVFALVCAACGSAPTKGTRASRAIASVSEEGTVVASGPTCMEKLTRLSCTEVKDGPPQCVCIPDDNEMYQTYP